MAKQNPLILNMIVVINMTISVLSLSTQAGDCESLGSLTCHGKRYQTFECSPPITSPTQAKLTNNNFAKGGDGGDPSECDNQYHPNSEPVVALSTGWYSGSSMCGNKILITASTGRSIVATVVDECDSRRGCDKEHAGLPPCRNDVVDGSDAVWEHLGLNTDEGVVDITWSMF